MSEREQSHFVHGVDVNRDDWHNEMMKQAYRTDTRPHTPAPGTHKERTASECARNESVAIRYYGQAACRVCRGSSREVDVWVVYMPNDEAHVVMSCWGCGQQAKVGKIQGDSVVPLG